MITLTEAAATQIRDLLANCGPEEDALRIYIKPGGCTGFSYGMALDSAKETDMTFEQLGVKVAIEKDSMDLIDGSEIDFVDDLTGQGFKISNPNATSMCGCGSSFRTATEAGQPGSCD